MSSTSARASDDLVDLVQQAYPSLWFACHVAHRTRHEPHPTGLTDREASVLAHVPSDGIDPALLADHLGMARPSLSAHISRLEGLGFIACDAVPGDGRRKRLRLTEAGRAARRASSALDADRVRAVLDAMPTDARTRAVDGLCALAAAARVVMRDSAAEAARAGDDA